MFQDRTEAGGKLSKKLEKYKNSKEVIILAVPRGGVPVGFEIAKSLNVPLDVVVVRKIGAPENPEYAVGAIDQNGKILKNPEVHVDSSYLEKKGAEEKNEIKRRIREYRGDRKELNLKDKIVILVDDGIATGLTTLKAIDFIRSKSPQKVILATPVISEDTALKLKKQVDELIYIKASKLFFAVGQFYQSFLQIGDIEVKKTLNKHIGKTSK